MSQPFLSEIRIFSFGYAPKSWAMCNGQLLPINQNQALFSLLGTTYGGNGQTTFALPNLQGQVPIHTGNSHTLGEKAGQTSHTITQSEMPQHLHPMNASNVTGDKVNPNFGGTGFILAQEPGNPYGPPLNLTSLNSGTITNVGGSQPHNNMMPY